MRKKLLHILLIALLSIQKASAQAFGENGAGIIPGEQNFFLIEWAAGFSGYIANALLVPGADSPQAMLIWFAGFALTIFGFYKSVSNFNDRVSWLDNDKEEIIVGFLLALIFIGGANFMGFLINIWYLLAIGVGMTLLFIITEVFIRKGRTAGGKALSLGHLLRTGSVGSYASGAAGAVTSYFGSPVQDVWNEYKDIPRCDNDHLNPQTPPAGTGAPYNCWVDGCGGDWTP